MKLMATFEFDIIRYFAVHAPPRSEIIVTRSCCRQQMKTSKEFIDFKAGISDIRRMMFAATGTADYEGLSPKPALIDLS